MFHSRRKSIEVIAAASKAKAACGWAATAPTGAGGPPNSSIARWSSMMTDQHPKNTKHESTNYYPDDGYRSLSDSANKDQQGYYHDRDDDDDNEDDDDEEEVFYMEMPNDDEDDLGGHHHDNNDTNINNVDEDEEMKPVLDLRRDPSVGSGDGVQSYSYKCEGDLNEDEEDSVFQWKVSLEAKYYPGKDVLLGQSDVTGTMRSTLLRWLAEVNRRFKYSMETFCLAVNVMDRFLAVQPLNRDCLQLLGLTSFFVAAKHEEMDPPEVSELVSLSARSYDHKQFKWMECIVLTLINFELMAPTSAYFLSHFAQGYNAKIKDKNHYGINDVKILLDQQVCHFLLEKLLCEEGFAYLFPPSKLAAFVVRFALKFSQPHMTVTHLNDLVPVLLGEAALWCHDLNLAPFGPHTSLSAYDARKI